MVNLALRASWEPVIWQDKVEVGVYRTRVILLTASRLSKFDTIVVIHAEDMHEG